MARTIISTLFSIILISTFWRDATAAPLVIDFEDVPTGGTFVSAPSLVSQGFNFARSPSIVNPFGGFLYVHLDGVGCSPICAANGTQTMMQPGNFNLGGDEIHMTKAGGGTFALAGFDAAEQNTGGFPEYSAASIDVEWYFNSVLIGGTSVIRDFIWDGPGGVVDFQSVAFNSALASLAADLIVFRGITGAGNGNDGYQVDNLLVDDDVAAAPTPASLSLLALGVFAVASGRRKMRGRASL